MWPDTSLIGWAGNTSVQDVIHRVSIIKTEADCPDVRLKLINGGHQAFHHVDFKLTSMVHPSGRCCKVLPPEHINNSTLGGILLRIDLKANVKFVEGYRIFLSNREESNDFHINSFNMHHDQLKASILELGYMQYDLEIHENLFLENNDDFRCKYYKHYGDYSSCLSKEYINQQLSILNCTPPWLTSREDLWCQHLMSLDTNAAKTLYIFFLS